MNATTETIALAEYDRLRAHDYAGPASSLLPQTREGWTGTHWVLRARKSGGTELAPVNVAGSRVIRPAYTIEPGNRIVLDGYTVTVLDVLHDNDARTVKLIPSYGAPRTVTFTAAVPVTFGT